MRIQNFILREIFFMKEFFQLGLFGILIIMVLQNYRLTMQLQSLQVNANAYTVPTYKDANKHNIFNPSLKKLYAFDTIHLQNVINALAEANKFPVSDTHFFKHPLFYMPSHAQHKITDSYPIPKCNNQVDSQSIISVKYKLDALNEQIIKKEQAEVHSDSCSVNSNKTALIIPNANFKNAKPCHLNNSKPLDTINQNRIFKDY